MGRLLADDAVLEMTGTTSWYSGKATCVPFIAAQAIGQAGDWRMVPLHACSPDSPPPRLTKGATKPRTTRSRS